MVHSADEIYIIDYFPGSGDLGFPTPTTGSATVSLAGVTEIKWTINAPAGQVVSVSPYGSDPAELVCYGEYAGNAGSLPPSSLNVSHNGLTGVAPTFSDNGWGSGPYGNGYSLYLAYTANVASAFSFSSITFDQVFTQSGTPSTFNESSLASYTMQMMDENYTGRGSAGLYSGPETAPYATILSTSTVPEQTVLALAGLGGLALLFRRRK